MTWYSVWSCEFKLHRGALRPRIGWWFNHRFGILGQVGVWFHLFGLQVDGFITLKFGATGSVYMAMMALYMGTTRLDFCWSTRFGSHCLDKMWCSFPSPFPGGLNSNHVDCCSCFVLGGLDLAGGWRRAGDSGQLLNGAGAIIHSTNVQWTGNIEFPDLRVRSLCK